MRKYLIIGVFLTLFTGLTVADGWYWAHEDSSHASGSLTFATVEYADGYTWRPAAVCYDCDENINQHDNPVIKLCGQEIDLSQGYTIVGDSDDNWEYYISKYDEIQIPENIPCTTPETPELWVNGNYFADLTGGDGSHAIKSNNMDNPHRGKNMILNIDVSGGELRNFQLTNDKWVYHLETGYDHGNVMIQNYDTGFGLGTDYEKGIYHLNPLEQPILSSGNSLNDLFQAPRTEVIESDVEDEELVQEVLGQTLPITEWSFTYGDVTYEPLIGSGHWEIDSQSPIHDHGNFRLDGDIILGYYPEYYSWGGSKAAKPGEGQYFFVCREGATMDNGFGEEVPQVVNTYYPDMGSRLYQCDPDTGLHGEGSGDWRLISECKSGLDHDGDGRIDHEDSWYHQELGGQDHDPYCIEPGTDKQDEKPDPCEKGAVLIEGDWAETDEVIYAQYEMQDETCSTDNENLDITSDDNLQWWSTGKEVETFTCYEDNELNQQELDDQARIDFCNTRVFGLYSTANGGPGMVPAVEYYPTPEYFEQLDATAGHNLEDGIETDFVDNQGWTTQMQTLREAEGFYSTGGNHPQLRSTWENKGMRNIDVYPEDDPVGSPDHQDAWTTAPAGADSSYGLLSTDEHDENSIFDGGFAGHCEEEGQRWQFAENPETGEDEWRCSGDIPWDQPVMLPETRGGFIGLIIPHTNLMSGDELVTSDDWTFFESFPVAVDVVDDADHWGSLSSLNATCWVGGPDRNPYHEDNDFPPEDEYIKDESAPVSDDAPFGIYGEVNIGDSEQYSCYWEYETTTSETISELGQVVPMQEDDQTLEQRDTFYPVYKDNHLSKIDGLKESYGSLSEFESETGTWDLAQVH